MEERLKPHLQALQTHYKAVRLSLLESQEQQAETIHNQVKQRKGFFKLSEDKAVAVLYPIQGEREQERVLAPFSTMSSIQGFSVYRSSLKIQGLGMRATSVAFIARFGITCNVPTGENNIFETPLA